MRLRPLAFVACGLILTGCSDLQLGPTEELNERPPTQFAETAITEIRCVTHVAASTLTCGLPVTGATAARGEAAATVGAVAIGGQHRFARQDRKSVV